MEIYDGKENGQYTCLLCKINTPGGQRFANTGTSNTCAPFLNCSNEVQLSTMNMYAVALRFPFTGAKEQKSVFLCTVEPCEDMICQSWSLRIQVSTYFWPLNVYKDKS